MRRGHRPLAFLLLLSPAVVSVWSGAARAADPGADEVMRRNFQVSKVADSRAEVTMTLIAPDGARRERATTSLSKLEPNGVDEKRLIRFQSPADVKGTATLSVQHGDAEDDLWVYLPTLRKVRRLLASNKKDSYVGTDFTYGDIVGHKVEDWTHVMVGSEPVGGADTWVIESTPRTDAVRDDTGYGKRKLWIRKDNGVAVKGEYWDAGGALHKRFEAGDVREIDPAHQKWQAFRIVMTDVQSGHATEIVWKTLEVGVGLGDDRFTERQLEKDA